MTGRTADGRIETRAHRAGRLGVANYGFDVTPARLVTGLITERGVLAATRDGAGAGFPGARAAERTAGKRAPRLSLRGVPMSRPARLAARRRPPVADRARRSRAAPRGCCTPSASAW